MIVITHDHAMPSPREGRTRNPMPHDVVHPDPMPDVAYVLAAATIVAAPGPDVLFALTVALSSGRRAGLLAVTGLSSGYVVHSALAAVGIGAVVAANRSVLFGLELLGAAYLVGVGLRQLVAVRRTAHQSLPAPPAGTTTWRRGFTTSVLNPKATLFFLAFLPQFLHGESGGWRAGLLGLTFAALSLAIYGLYVTAAGAFGERLATDPRTARRLGVLASVVFVALGSLTFLRLAAG
jgi:threonine/homoserine/homoserine lactone efflux protein